MNAPDHTITALPLAADAEVHAVEGDPAMIAALDRAARATRNLHRVSTDTRDLFRRPLEPDELKGFTGAVIDPPRAGPRRRPNAWRKPKFR